MRVVRVVLLIFILMGLTDPAIAESNESESSPDSAGELIREELTRQAALIEGLEDELQDLGLSMQSLRELVDSNMAVQTESYRAVEKSIADNESSVKATREALNNRFGQLLKQQNSAKDSLLSQVSHFNSELVTIREAQAQVASSIESLALQTERSITVLEKNISRSSLITYIMVVVGILIFLAVFISTTKRTGRLERVFEEQASLDLKLSTILENQLLLTRNAPVQAETHQPALDLDHSLPVRVGEEMFRMRVRMANVNQETKGLVALGNALCRLEDELNANGYAVKDLTGQDYVEEMTAIVKGWEPKREIDPGQRKIIRMIRPQILYKDTVISPGEIVVGISISDSIYSDRG